MAAEISSRDARIRKTVVLVLMLAVAALMLWAAKAAIPTLLYARLSTGWPQTAGRIKSSELQTVHNDKSRDYHTPDISYEYQVEGRVYSGMRFRFQDRSIEKEFGGISKYLEKFPVGGRVKVFYNPKDPSISVLYPGVNLMRLLVGGGAFFLIEIVFIGLIFLLVRDWRKVDDMLKEDGIRQIE